MFYNTFYLVSMDSRVTAKICETLRTKKGEMWDFLSEALTQVIGWRSAKFVSCGPYIKTDPAEMRGTCLAEFLVIMRFT